MCWKRIQERHADMITIFVEPEHKIDPVILPEVFPGGRARELESVQPAARLINNSPLWNLVPATPGASMAPRNRARRQKLAPAGGAAAYA